MPTTDDPTVAVLTGGTAEFTRWKTATQIGDDQSLWRVFDGVLVPAIQVSSIICLPTWRGGYRYPDLLLQEIKRLLIVRVRGAAPLTESSGGGLAQAAGAFNSDDSRRITLLAMMRHNLIGRLEREVQAQAERGRDWSIAPPPTEPDMDESLRRTIREQMRTLPPPAEPRQMAEGRRIMREQNAAEIQAENFVARDAEMRRFLREERERRGPTSSATNLEPERPIRQSRRRTRRPSFPP